MTDFEYGDPPEWANNSEHLEVFEEPVVPARQQDLWPGDLHSQAYYGIAGEIVSALEPQTEADPAALLTNLLIAFGNALGRSTYFVAAGTRHHMNLFAALVGETSKARKGTSWTPIENLFKRIEPEWVANNISSGLSSGEGLIWSVRDPITQRQPIKDDGRVVDYQDVMIDTGITDKRLLVLEEEFGRTLQSMGREGNILSAVIRQAWDSGKLRAMTKTSPAKATDAHISIIGHITIGELLRLLKANDTSNGFANRFLWMAVRRSKCLPEGGNLDDSSIESLAKRLGERLAIAKFTQEVRRDEEAKEIWAEVYATLSEGKPGILGSVTSRAEAQVMRLACLYALLDGSSSVRVPHLFAALAIWNRSESSAKYIFGTMTGDPVADTIRNALVSTSKLNRTDISKLFGKNLDSGRIDKGLGLLYSLGIAQSFKTYTSGRPEIIWKLKECTK